MDTKIYLLSPMAQEGTIALPMIQFTLLFQEIDFETYDLLMFTSKQAVKSIEVLNPRWKDTPCIAIGDATAGQIELMGGKVVYQPSAFYSKTLSDEIVDRFREKKILYLRPKEVSFDAKAYLKTEGINLSEKMIYETSCIVYEGKQKPLKNAIVIFTSPSTIRCFFKNFVWDESYRAVVIGEATKKHLPLEVTDVHTASFPQISACLKKAQELLLTSNSK